jgi:hypothetical protein
LIQIRQWFDAASEPEQRGGTQRWGEIIFDGNGVGIEPQRLSAQRLGDGRPVQRAIYFRPRIQRFTQPAPEVVMALPLIPFFIRLAVGSAFTCGYKDKGSKEKRLPKRRRSEPLGRYAATSAPEEDGIGAAPA